MKTGVVLAAVLAVQAACALFFIWDILSALLGLQAVPMAWETRELIEIGAALGLALGLVTGALALMKQEMEPFDASDRFFRLAKQPDSDYISRDDFFPFIHALLQDHPGLEFLSSHAEFQEKYALTVITRIFYSVNKCHSGKITARQIRRSDLLDAFHQVDEEEDINKVTRYLSYEHFYVLYWYVVMMMLLHRRKFGNRCPPFSHEMLLLPVLKVAFGSWITIETTALHETTS